MVYKPSNRVLFNEETSAGGNKSELNIHFMGIGNCDVPSLSKTSATQEFGCVFSFQRVQVDLVTTKEPNRYKFFFKSAKH